MKKLIIKGILFMLIIGYVISVPIYGQASNLKKQGNLIGFDKEIRNMKQDYHYLENEIISLMEECK